MVNPKNKEVKLELLVSTMNRNSLIFLDELFPNDNYKNFNILIVNQTDQTHKLVSNIETIRVINSDEKGLAKSRNLAIENAIGDICLIVDDDVKFKPNFETIILDAFNKHKKATIITYMLEDFEGNLFRTYPKVTKHNLESIKQVNSVVISFNRSALIESDLKFNTNFGLGATFETADEYIFMRDALQQQLPAFFESKIILSHPKYSSGQDNASDRLIFARSALYYKYSGILGYLKLIKHLFLLHNNGELKLNQILEKFKIGLKGIKAYKLLKQ